MTLADLIRNALAELEYPSDTAALPLWEEKLIRFANEAVTDVAETFRLWRRDPLPLQNGVLTLSALPYAVSKVLGVERGGVRLPFYYGESTGVLRVPNVPDGTVTVVYRYQPATLAEPTDVPQLPACCHPLLVTYMVARFCMQNDAQSMNHASAALSVYESQKRRLKLDFDEPSGYAFYHVF
ncbi:MAG: hypothetical protein IJJ86_02855 [Clostridia bacterium]|nr:hypothetical protein [Clostridia bacterium]